MISFRDPKDQLPSALAIAGIALLLVSAVANFTVRSKSIATEKRKVNKELATLDERLDKANVDLSAAESRKINVKRRQIPFSPRPWTHLPKSLKRRELVLLVFGLKKLLKERAFDSFPFHSMLMAPF